MKRDWKGYMLLTLKGLAMGAADVVPGVSGGSIAFITGIYEEMLHTLQLVNLKTFRILFTSGFAAFWKALNGNFLLALFTGIVVSIFSLAKGIEYLLLKHPMIIWSFFFGLISASALFVTKSVGKFNVQKLLVFHGGMAVTIYLTNIAPVAANQSYWFVFVTGALSICATLLPGISGSSILILLGMYQFIVLSITHLNVEVITIFTLGAFIGLISFSNILSWFLKKFKSFTIALLAGFMIGAATKAWPWKKVIEWKKNSEGKLIPLIEDNILPTTYSQTPINELATGNNDPQWLLAIAMVLLGAATMIFFELTFNKPKKQPI